MKKIVSLNPKHAFLMANGDLRLSANQKCWPEQEKMEEILTRALRAEGWTVVRAHSYDKTKKHGFIDSQKMGMEVFRRMDPAAPLIVAESVWQYSHHLLHGLFTHQGPILTVANWSGTWPGLVGMLNLNGSLTKAGVRYSTLWSEKFTDPLFKNGLREWLNNGAVHHEQSHVRDLARVTLPEADEELGRGFGREFKRHKAIMGIFDEGCMGMYNAIVPDELLSPLGVSKERLSQSTLYARMLATSDQEARQILDWLKNRGMKFCFGSNEESDLTENQVLQQCKMYLAAVRIAHEFGCSTIGIQYQQGLKDLAPASDLVEGILNNTERPPVYDEVTGEELYPSQPLPHFNEVDECAGRDALITNRIWQELGFPPETTLH